MATTRKIKEEDLDGDWQLISDEIAVKAISCSDGYVVVYAKCTLKEDDHFELEIIKIDEHDFQ